MDKFDPRSELVQRVKYSLLNQLESLENGHLVTQCRPSGPGWTAALKAGAERNVLVGRAASSREEVSNYKELQFLTARMQLKVNNPVDVLLAL